MDVMNGGNPSAVTFEKICNDAVWQSTLTLAGHVSARAFQSSLSTVVNTRTGINIDKWSIGGQFIPAERVSSLLPPGLLLPSRRHLTHVCAGDFYSDSTHFGTYFDITGDNARPSVSPTNLAAEFGDEPATPSRPACMKISTISPSAACSIITALTNLRIGASREDIDEKMGFADKSLIASLNTIFSVPEGKTMEETKVNMATAIVDVLRAGVSPSSVGSSRPARALDDDSRSAGRNLRDDTIGDEVCRNVVASLALVQNSLRLTMKALRRRKLMPESFIPVETLPVRAAQQIASHLRLQQCIQAIVLKAVNINSASDARSASIVRDRLASLDPFMAEQIDDGATCEFTTFERAYGVLSVGCFSVLAATYNYVPGDSPDVLALYAAAQSSPSALGARLL